MIRLTTLGTIRVECAGTANVELAGQQPKRLALLTYLAVARPLGPHRRDTILALLWPELDQDRARSALRQALHGLRRTLGPSALISSGNESVAIDRDVVRCDLWELEDAASAGDHSRVLRLYDGELAAGLFVNGATDFDEWMSGERARVRSIVRASAWAEADSAAARRRSAEAVQHARRALAMSELDESAVRRAMRLAASVGDSAAAVSIYESFAGLLHRELDVEPSGETRAVLDDLRRDSRLTSATVTSGPGPRDVDVVRRTDQSPLRPVAAGSTTRSVRPSAVAAAAAVVVALAAAARLAPSAPSSLDARRVRVAEFANESSIPALDTLARTATLTTRATLLRLDNVRVVSTGSRAGDRGDDAGTVVRGLVRMGGDSIELRADVVDRTTGAIVRGLAFRFPTTASATAVDAFADRVTAAVATALYPGWGSALSQPPSYAGYRAFLEGMRSIKRERHDLALAAFRRAYEEDSTFTAAGLLAGLELYQMRRYAAADSLALAIAPRRETLPRVDAHLLDWLQRSLGGDRIGARTAMAAIVALAPSAELAGLQLAIDNVETARPDVALAMLDRIDPEGDFGEGWVSYWATRIEALHIAGDHARELVVVRNALRRHPEMRVLGGYELRALAALGRLAEVERAVAALSAMPSTDGFDTPTALRQTALELAAHGHDAAARRVLGSARAWYESRPASEHSTMAYRVGLARTAFLADDRREAARLYRAVLAEYPKCVDCVGALGVLAARGGNRPGADSSLTLLEQVRRPFFFGRQLEWQARIAAASGDLARAASLQAAAFGSGAEFDVLTHVDPDLRAIRPDSIYRAFARVP